MAKRELKQRIPRYNRFQTPAFGGYIVTAVDAHFDPFLEPTPQVKASNAQMESVARVMIPNATSKPGR